MHCFKGAMHCSGGAIALLRGCFGGGRRGGGGEGDGIPYARRKRIVGPVSKHRVNRQKTEDRTDEQRKRVFPLAALTLLRGCYALLRGCYGPCSRGFLPRCLTLQQFSDNSFGLVGRVVIRGVKPPSPPFWQVMVEHPDVSNKKKVRCFACALVPHHCVCVSACACVCVWVSGCVCG